MNRTLMLSIAACLAALLTMTNRASAGIISDQTQFVTDKGTVELIVDQLDWNTYKATLTWGPTGYTGGTTDYISNTAVKLTSHSTNESLLAYPNGVWGLEPNAASNFGAADGCGGNDQGSLCAKSTDETNTTDSWHTWIYQFDTSSLFTEDKFHVQVQFHNANDSPGGQISTLFDGGDCIVCTATTSVPEPATLALLGLGLAGLRISQRKHRATSLQRMA